MGYAGDITRHSQVYEDEKRYELAKENYQR